jgi:site-specific DNA recombinase
MGGAATDLPACSANHAVHDPVLVDLVWLWLEAYAPSGLGVPQGSPLSPLLANIYLDAVDEEIEGRGVRLVRFADDFLLLCKTDGLYVILQNRIYRGEIVHKGVAYPGQHAAIVDGNLWEAAASRLKANRSDRETGRGAQEPSLLTGLLFDSEGSRMTPTHASKDGKRYRYYVSQSLIEGNRKANPRGRRVPAGDIERLRSDRLKAFIGSRVEIHEALAQFNLAATDQQRLLGCASDLSRNWDTKSPAVRRHVLRTVISRVVLNPSHLTIELDRSRILGALQSGSPAPTGIPMLDASKFALTLTVAAETKRAGKATRLIVEDGVSKKPDANLIKLLVKAFEVRDQLFSGQPGSIDSLARRTRASGSYMTCLVRLTYLAPDIIEAILCGRHPVTLSARRLITTTKELPIDWAAQRQWLEFLPFKSRS